jgi:hypothetical protein
MNKKLPFILTTLIGFIVGTATGMWITRTPPIPAPPASILEEIKEAPLGSDAPAPTAIAATADNQAAYAKIRDEMDDFKRKVDAIKASLRTEMDALLTDEQREIAQRTRERPAPPPPAAASGSGQALPARPTARNFYEGFDSTITIIMVPYSLERLDSNLRFTPGQKAAVHRLLIERRAKFLDLVDTTPPPSFKLINLAPPEARVPAAEK